MWRLWKIKKLEWNGHNRYLVIPSPCWMFPLGCICLTPMSVYICSIWLGWYGNLYWLMMSYLIVFLITVWSSSFIPWRSRYQRVPKYTYHWSFWLMNRWAVTMNSRISPDILWWYVNSALWFYFLMRVTCVPSMY